MFNIYHIDLAGVIMDSLIAIDSTSYRAALKFFTLKSHLFKAKFYSSSLRFNNDDDMCLIFTQVKSFSDQK